MEAEAILAPKPKVLTQEQGESCFSDRYLLLDRFVSEEWIDRLLAATDRMVKRSREVTEADSIFGLEPGHCAEEPRLRCVSSPVDHDPEYWAFGSTIIADGTPRSTLFRDSR